MPRLHAYNKFIYLIQKVEQLTDVVRDGWCVWVSSLEMLLVDFAHTFHAFIDTFVIRISARFGPCAWLHQQNCVRHCVCIFVSSRYFGDEN